MIADMLEALRTGYLVSLTSIGPGWRLVITARDERTPFERVYMGRNLARVVRAAWAGEPAGRVS